MVRIFSFVLLATGACFGLTLAVAAPAYAYLDPGTGSIIIQSIIGGIAAASAFGAMYWTRFKDFLARVGGKSTTEDKADSK